MICDYRVCGPALSVVAAIALCSSSGACRKATTGTATGTQATASHADHQPAAAAAANRPAPVIDTAPAPGPAPAGMVWVPGGSFWMGCENCGMPDALPVHL